MIPVTASGLTVVLAGDTPAPMTVADNANANFTKFTLTAGSEGDVSVSKIYVTRSGLSLNSDVENIKIIEADTGVHRGSIGSLSTNSKALITFTPALVIEAGTTESFFIRAGFIDTATAGKTAMLGIASANDIISNATEVNGLPITGNAMTVVTLAIGTVAVAEDGTTIDSTPDVGDTDVTVNQFKATVGSAEPVTIEQITVIKAGTADASDTNNIELYDVTNGVSLGTVASWDSESKASWSNLNIKVAKGKTHRFKVMVDILDGPSLTVNADLVDGSDVLLTAKGDTYGFYITPSATGSWAGQATNNQTINSGALNVSKSTSAPATGSVAVADDVTLGAFDFDVRGEEIKITALTITLTTTDATGSTFLANDITNMSIYDEDGTIVAGPKDATGSAAAAQDFDFTDTFIVPVGVHTYYIEGDIGTDAATDDTVVVDVKTPGTTTVLTATGMTSNSSITATPSGDVAANTLTVAAGSMTVTTLDTPAARSVAKGISDFVWATASLDAGTSGEDVQVSTINVYDTTSATADADNIDNMEIWADLTDEDSARGDIYETRVSNAENPSGNDANDDVETSFTLTQTITVTQTTFTKIALVADLATGATESATHTFTFTNASDDAGTFTGASTGSSIAESVSGSGQAMTVAANGTLTITKDASSPVADILVSGKTQTLNIFRLAANNVEDLDLDNITLTLTGGTNIDTLYFYHGDTLLGSRPGGSTARIDIPDGTVTVPANGNVKITVKGKMLTVDESVVTSNTDIGAVISEDNGDIETTGLASGQAVDSTAHVSSSTHQLYRSRPYFAVNSASPSGVLVPSTQDELAIFDVTAEDTEDITFESTSDQIVIQISNTVGSSDGTAGTWYLKDEDGTQLSSISVADTDTSVTFTFEDNTFTIPAGQTKKLYVYGDTSDYSTDGDVIQLWLDDSTDANCTFGIDLTQGYAEAAIIFRGDIYAGSFTNPS
jgi:hypothetical protein